MNAVLSLARYILWFAPAVAILPAGRLLVQYFQLSSYQFGGFLRTLSRQRARVFWPGLALTLLSVLFTFLASLSADGPWLLETLLSLAAAGLILLSGSAIGFFAYQEKKAKKKLVVTPRVKRLGVAWLVVALIVSGLLRRLYVMGISALVVPALLPLWLVIAALIMWPVEKGIQLLYQTDAKRILEGYKKSGLTAIGITGSYGKTTVKNVLASILSQQYPTLASPVSANTPVALSRCIRDELGPQHRYFIAEMGARHPQDIRVLSRFIKPSLGILTAIGPQHLETLGSEEKVRETKYALIQGLPPDGFAVFNDDGRHVSASYRRAQVEKALVGEPGDDLWAEDIALSPEGSSFTLHGKGGLRQPCETKLPGEHNIRNILLAAAAALRLGLSPAQVAQGVAQVKTVAFRLQASRHPKGYIAINNGFNTNPAASLKALEVLASYPGRHVVVTPGFIELGKQEEAANRQLGRDMAAVAQEVLLVGVRRTQPIREGLLEAEFDESHIHTFPSLTEANRHVNQAYGEGDVVLYENDLPDQYS
ncbi:MAG: UDP-N-acetylmuramoyl-tripeptide--D-alanyl-D-alanine ligase [Eubacteriales bacterium]|nr:UDP-N-acetylmuramoyl-tripeptide--D-alanyl-D-alanine ligase [Eubacteriales bacterium]